MKIAILASSKGSVFRYALEILQKCGSKTDFFMISDRVCDAEKIATDYSLPLQRIEAKDNKTFSKLCREHISKLGGTDAVMTFVWRLVTEELFNHYPCINIHPALLPAFKGFHAVEQAFDTNVKFFGSTLHMVDADMDHGQVIAQTQMPCLPGMTLAQMTEAAFIQDVYLMLLVVDLLEHEVLKVFPPSVCEVKQGLFYTDRCNPLLLNDRYLEEIKKLQASRNITVIK